MAICHAGKRRRTESHVKNIQLEKAAKAKRNTGYRLAVESSPA